MELDEIIDDPIVSMLWGPGISSATRLGHMLDALFLQEGDAFWRVFATIWPSCGNGGAKVDQGSGVMVALRAA